MEVETRYGILNILDSQEDIVSNFLRRYGEWSQFEIEFIAANIDAEAAVADIGAFLGTFGIGLSQARKLRKVCFVEANPNVMPFLRSNVRRNSHTESIVLHALMCPDDFEVEAVSRHGGNEGSTSFGVSSGGEVVSGFSLPNVRLSLPSLIQRSGPFDLIKLDIEGLELDLLARVDPALMSNVTVWSECNETVQSLDLAELLLSWGLRLYYFAYPSFNPKNRNRDEEAIFPLAYEAGLFASSKKPTLPGHLLAAECYIHEIENREDLREALWKTPRWCPLEIQAPHTCQMVALAVRTLRSEMYDSFLAPGSYNSAFPQSKKVEVCRSCDDDDILRIAHARLQVQLSEQSDTIDQITDRVRRLEQELDVAYANCAQHMAIRVWQENIMSQRLQLLSTERVERRNDVAVEHIARLEAEERALQFENLVTSMRGSRAWRLAQFLASQKDRSLFVRYMVSILLYLTRGPVRLRRWIAKIRRIQLE